MKVSQSLNINLNVQLIKSNYNILPTDDILLVDASGGDVTLTLPPYISIEANNTPFTIKKIDSGFNNVIVASNINIDGLPSISWHVPYQSLSVVTDGNTYYSSASVFSGNNGSLNILGQTLSDGSGTSVIIDAGNANIANKYGGSLLLYSGNASTPGYEGAIQFLPKGLHSGSFEIEGSFSTYYGRVDRGANYQAPLTGFNITFPDQCQTLILNPAGVLAAGTIVMPLNATYGTPYNGQIIRIASTQTITALTVNANAGQSINNSPTTLLGGTGFSYIYRAANETWYRLY